MPAVKVATCCYCGMRAALVLSGETRHELACGSCGAPLRQLKMLRKPPVARGVELIKPRRPEPKNRDEQDKRKPRNRPKKCNNLSRLRRNVFEEIWIFFEDIID